MPNTASASETHLFIFATEACSSSVSGRSGTKGEWSGGGTLALGVFVASRLGIWKIFGTAITT